MDNPAALSMTAAVLERCGEPLRIRTGIEIPPLKAGQLLVKVAYSGVCRSQLMEVRGLRGKDSYLPHLLGHEGSGWVVRAGPGVRKLRAGDPVILGWIKGEGLDGGGCQYQCEGTTIQSGGVTTFSNYTVVSENRCVRLPPGLPMDVAVLFGCALPTGAGIVLNELDLERTDTVAVWGLGGIGMSALMACGARSCKERIAIDREESKLRLARDFGATHLILAGQAGQADREDPVARVLAITEGRGVDYSVEASGNTRMIEQAFAAVRPKGGLCVFASHPAHGERIELDPYDLIRGRKIQGSWGGASVPDRDVPLLHGLFLEGKLPLGKLLSPPYALRDVNQALGDLESGKIGRALLAIDPDGALEGAPDGSKDGRKPRF